MGSFHNYDIVEGSALDQAQCREMKYNYGHTGVMDRGK